MNKDPDQSDSIQGFSTIRFFSRLKKEITKATEFPLREQDIVINKDAYAALGDEDSSSQKPFAVIALDHFRSDNDLRFSFEFFEESVGVSIPDFLDPFLVPYDEIDDDEGMAALKLANVIVALANGQLSFLLTLTEEDDKVQATEILYRAPSTQKYEVLYAIPFFVNAPKKLRLPMSLTTKHHVNKTDAPEVKVSKSLARLILTGENEQPFSPRKFIKDLSSPLTREVWETALDKYADEAAERSMKKFDIWTGYDYEGANKRTYKENYILFSRMRHTSLLVVGVVVMFLLGLMLGWSQAIVTVMIVSVLTGSILASVKSKLPGKTAQIAKALLGYAAIGYVFYLLLAMDKSIFAWILLGFVTIEIIEALVLDVYFSIFKRDSKKQEQA